MSRDVTTRAPRYVVGGLLVRVNATAEVLEHMNDYLGGWPSDPGANGHTHTAVELSAEIDEHPERMWPRRLHRFPTVTSHPEQEYAICKSSEGRLWVPMLHGRHVIRRTPGAVHVVAANANDAGTQCCRVIRQLLTQDAVVSGGTVLHASTANAGTRTVAFVGPSGSGKTGSTLSMLDTTGARPVANDKVAVRPGPDGGWVATGLPYAWRVSPEAVTSFPALQQAFSDRTLLRGVTLVKGKVEFTPGEIERAFGTTTRVAAPLTDLVAIRPDRTSDTFSVTHGSPAISSQDIKRLSSFITPTVLADWLDLRSDVIRPARQGTFDWESFCGPMAVSEVVWTTPDDFPVISQQLIGAR